ncbi:MAG: YWFCY domain-containing protein [Bacteroidota bacterium]|nr:YWFCY domain-containing protein [Bacteroidota bacterium]
MNEQHPDQSATQNFSTIALAGALSLLFFHFYRCCPVLHDYARADKALSMLDGILTRFAKGPLFTKILVTKLLVLGLLLLHLALSKRNRDPGPERGHPMYSSLVGSFLFFASGWIFDGAAPADTETQWTYIALCMAGFFISWYALENWVVLAWSRLINRDVFNREGSSFPQERRLIPTSYSVNLPTRFFWQGRTRAGWINFINMRRGLLVMGSPGSGKTRFVIRGVIRQLIRKGFPMFVYDFKYPELTRLAHDQFMAHKHKFPPGTRFWIINFSDLSRTHRCNAIDPRNLDSMTAALDVSRTLLLSMNRTWVNRQGDFWVESPMNFLASIIWFLRKVEDGRYCTLPHAIEIANAPYEQLFAVLGTQPEVEGALNQFRQALDSKNFELLDSQAASVRTPLARLASPDFYYILSGNDVQLDINNPAAPAIFCLGGNAEKQEALAPVLSLYIDRLCRSINKPGGHPSAVICDEFATVRSPALITTLATGRSNNIATTIAFQDISQLKMSYSTQEADTLVNMAGNIICGQALGETAKRLSDRFLQTLQKHISTTYHSRETSVNESERPGTTILPATLSNLSSGEFVGIVADDPDCPIDLKAFHGHIIGDEKALKKEDAASIPLPLVNRATPEDVTANFHRIRQEVRDLMKGIISRLASDPEFSG